MGRRKWARFSLRFFCCMEKAALWMIERIALPGSTGAASRCRRSTGAASRCSPWRRSSPVQLARWICDVSWRRQAMVCGGHPTRTRLRRFFEWSIWLQWRWKFVCIPMRMARNDYIYIYIWPQWCSNITTVDPLEWLLPQYYIRLFKIKWEGVKHYNAIGFSGWISINLNSILVWTSIPGFWPIAIQCGTPPAINDPINHKYIYHKS